jgi:hypothetical protein
VLRAAGAHGLFDLPSEVVHVRADPDDLADDELVA